MTQLENLCEERGIKVEFIKYSFIDGGSESEYGKPVIKVHKIFKECPMKVAAAVVEVFTGEGYTSDCIEIMEGYLREKFGPIGIKLQPPRVIKIKPVVKAVMPSDDGDEENYFTRDELYIEADISSIDAIDLRGVQKKLSSNEILMEKEQNILELDIVVDPPLHK